MQQPDLVVEAINHRDAATAVHIHAVLMLASAQEAALLQTDHLPALAQTAADVQASVAFYLGAVCGDVLLGALSLGPDDEAGQINIASLVVHPAHQRQGVATALLAEALRRASGMVVCVATAAGNSPALALYRGCGFVDYRSGVLSDAGLQMIKLRRAPTALQ